MLTYTQFEALITAGETVARDRQESGRIGDLDFASTIDSILIARACAKVGIKATAHRENSVLGYYVRQAVSQGFFDMVTK